MRLTLPKPLRRRMACIRRRAAVAKQFASDFAVGLRVYAAIALREWLSDESCDDFPVDDPPAPIRLRPVPGPIITPAPAKRRRLAWLPTVRLLPFFPRRPKREAKPAPDWQQYRADELAAQAIDLEQVRAAYGEERERVELSQESIRAIRAAAFHHSGLSGRAYKASFRRAFQDGDMDGIPGFDCLAQIVAGLHPELAACGDDPAQSLFEILRDSAPAAPRRPALWRRAVDRVLDCCRYGDECGDVSFNFGVF